MISLNLAYELHSKTTLCMYVCMYICTYFYHEMVVLQSFSQFTKTRFAPGWPGIGPSKSVCLPAMPSREHTCPIWTVPSYKVHQASLVHCVNGRSATLPVTSEMNPKKLPFKNKIKQQCRFQCNIGIAFKIMR